MRTLTLVIAIALSATLARADEPAAAGSDEVLIRGTWQLVSQTKEGIETKAADSADDIPLEVTFDERMWRAKIGPKGAPIEITGGYTLDPKQTPKLLDVTVDGNGNSTSINSIYKIEKDQLHVRLPSAGGQRPVDFDIAAPDCTTVVFRRAPKA